MHCGRVAFGLMLDPCTSSRKYGQYKVSLIGYKKNRTKVVWIFKGVVLGGAGGGVKDHCVNLSKS